MSAAHEAVAGGADHERAVDGQTEAQDLVARSRAESLRAERRDDFRYQVLKTLVLHLFKFELPADRVRLLLERIEQQALVGFPDLIRGDSGPWVALSFHLLERVFRIEQAIVYKPDGKGRAE